MSNVSDALAIHLAAAGQRDAALSIILANSEQTAGPREIAEFIRITEQRHIDLTKIMVAEDSGRLLWAILPVATPGRTLLMLSPNHVTDLPQLYAAERLTDAICQQYNDCSLAQVLVDPAAVSARSLYPRLGFTEIGELIYLHAPVRKPKKPLIFLDGFYFEHYSLQNHPLFAQAIRDSYQESLDCPALNGIRDIEDVILGHQAAGGMGGVAEFSPKLWRVLLQRHADGPKPVGVLLLCRTDPADGMELVYLGLSLPARRHGLGAMLVQQALATAAEENRKRMTLAVDSRNAPAIRLYYRHGFQKAGAKIAFIRDLRPVPAISPPLV